MGRRTGDRSSQSVTGSATITEGSLVQDWSLGAETVAPEHHFEGRNGRWLIGLDVANALKSRDFVVAARTGTYDFDDGATTNASATLTSAAQGGFAARMIGAAVSGTGIPAGTTITAVASATSCTMSAAATATGTGVRVSIVQTTTLDVIYVKHRGAQGPTVGVGATPPNAYNRFQVAADDSDTAMGGVAIRVGPSQTGDAIAVHDSNGVLTGKKWWITKDFYHTGASTFGVRFQAEATNQRCVLMGNSGLTALYGFSFSGTAMQLRYLTGSVDLLKFDTDGGITHQSSKIGFFSTAPVVKPAVTGSRGANAALASLLTALAGLGLVTDSST